MKPFCYFVLKLNNTASYRKSYHNTRVCLYISNLPVCLSVFFCICQLLGSYGQFVLVVQDLSLYVFYISYGFYISSVLPNPGCNEIYVPCLINCTSLKVLQLNNKYGTGFVIYEFIYNYINKLTGKRFKKMKNLLIYEHQLHSAPRT